MTSLENGAGNRVRTGDLYLGKVPLYQLSYPRESLYIDTTNFIFWWSRTQTLVRQGVS